MMRPTTIEVTERVTSEARLRPADVDFLLSHHRCHVRLLPTAQRGRYHVTPLGYVGTIVAPCCRLQIRPKIRSSLLHLLFPGPARAVDDACAVAPGLGPLDLLAARLAELLAERTARGLHRGYAERAEQGPFLQGRLDVPAQLRRPGGAGARLHCTWDDFTPDVPCNQIPKAAAQRVLDSGLLDPEVAAALQRSLAGLANVTPYPLIEMSGALAAVAAPIAEYGPVLQICRLLVDGLQRQAAAGDTSFPAFLLDMDRLFERYVTAAVRAVFAAAPAFTVKAQELHVANRRRPGQPDIRLRPDVVIYGRHRPLIVVDAKWKGPTRTPRSAADLYQMLAYATALGVERVVLVYPGRKDAVAAYRLRHSPVRLQIQRLRVSGSGKRCAHSLEKFGKRFRRYAGLINRASGTG